MAASQAAGVSSLTGRDSGGLLFFFSVRKITGVETATRGLTSTIGKAGSSGAGVISSPMPRATSGRPSRHIGTSAPSRSAKVARDTGSIRTFHRSSNPRSAAAASADPPPIPEAMGRFFSR
ncbi:hypothetical protein D3C87_1699840 [compost metagenome]